jgi:hypothetical protein
MILADDGGDTVAKAIPQRAAPLLDYPAYGPQSDSLVEYRAYLSDPIGSLVGQAIRA